MKYRSIPGIAKDVSVLAQGQMLNNVDDMQPDFEMLDRVFAQGINTFDNAQFTAVAAAT